MAARNLTIDDLTSAIKNGTSYTGAGQFDGAHKTFLLQPQGQLSNAEQYNQLIVGQSERRADLSEGRRGREGQRAGRAH